MNTFKAMCIGSAGFVSGLVYVIGCGQGPSDTHAQAGSAGHAAYVVQVAADGLTQCVTQQDEAPYGYVADPSCCRAGFSPAGFISTDSIIQKDDVDDELEIAVLCLQE